MREGDVRREQQELAWITMQQHVEFRNLEKPKLQRQQCHNRQKWSRPLNGFMKVNVDGGFSKEGGHGSWGYVIRDDEGEVIQAEAGKIRNALEA